MGRKSRKKRERRKRGAGPVARVAHGRSRASLLALLEAASVSPNASQYILSLSVIFESVVRYTRVGDERAGSALLDPLIRAARRECPTVAMEETFLPHDPRLDVRVEWSGEVFRMIAGALERPASDIERMRRLAEIVDPTLCEHMGYSLTDIVELVLRRVDVVTEVLAPVWPLNLERELGSPSQLRPEELAAASLLPPLEEQISQCGDPERVRVALQAHSVSAKQLHRREFAPLQTEATFGGAIAVRYGKHGFAPLPTGLMVEAIDALAGELAVQSLTFDSSLERRWRDATWKLVGDMFVGAGNDVIGPLPDEGFPWLHSVIRYNDSQCLAVSVAASLDREGLQDIVVDTGDCLEKVMPGCTLRTIRGTESIPDSARLYRLLIIAAPQAVCVPIFPRGKSAVITLQDLGWIRRTIGREEIDLWYFVRDLVEQSRLGRISALHGIDLWEVWKGQGKSFYRGASDIGGMYIDPNYSQLEWQKVSEQQDINSGLRVLGMGRISDWPYQVLTELTRS